MRVKAADYRCLMPLDYHISPDEGLITISGDGEVSLAAIAELGQSLLGDTAYDPALPQLLDFRGLRPLPESSLDELQAFVHGPYREAVAGSVAVVIDEHLEGQHVADIFLLTCAIHQAELFSDYDLALKWLMRHAFARYRSAQQENAAGDGADGSPD